MQQIKHILALSFRMCHVTTSFSKRVQAQEVGGTEEGVQQLRQRQGAASFHGTREVVSSNA